MTNIVVHLASEYPNYEKRVQLEELNLESKNLTGELNFTHLGFTNLKRLNLAKNKITQLILPNPQQITHLNISDNQISDLRFTKTLVENETGRMECFEFINNPLPDDFKKKLLKSR